jgi:D-alanyl-D-alanine carboxypeptidase
MQTGQPVPPVPRGRARRRAVWVFGLILVGFAALTSCFPAGYGWSTGRSGSRSGYTASYSAATYSGAANGFLPPSMLVYISPRCRVAHPVAQPLVNMLQAAAWAGVQLWTVSCYRTYQQQVILRQSWCARGECGMAAPPGTSNHGWGKAVDLGEPGGMTFTSPGYRWLRAHAGAYGFVGLSFEAWHWTYVG